MPQADRAHYLLTQTRELRKEWPNNHRFNIVCHGHSVPAGYTALSVVRTFDSYPHLMHRLLAEKFPTAVMNVIVSAIGGENSEQGSLRFEEDVLCYKPDLITLDYGLNDRGIGIDAANTAWRSMIEKAKQRNIPMILLTPSMDMRTIRDKAEFEILKNHADLIKGLAAEYGLGLVDVFDYYSNYSKNGGDVAELLSWVNHPNLKGHTWISEKLAAYFPMDI